MMKILVAVFCIAGVAVSASQHSGKAVTELFDYLLEKYDARVRPHYGEGPLGIHTTVYFIRGIKFNEKDGLLSLEGYYRESWHDPRLEYPVISGRPDYITTRAQLTHKIWEPDTFIANGEARTNGKDVFIKISSSGDVMKSTKNVIEIMCPENFRNYPMDNQRCEIETESYGYSAKDVIMKFARKPHPVGSATLEFGNMHVFAIEWQEKGISLTTGNYSRLSIGLHLSRNPGNYIKYFYAPAILMFIVCWATFWLPSSSILLRGILAFMSLNVCLTLLRKGGEDIPQIGYMTRLDQYMVTCSILALVTLLESFTVYYLQRNRIGNLKNVEDEDGEIAIDLSQPKQPVDTKETNGLKMIGTYIDKGARYALNIRHHRRGHEKIDILFRFGYTIFFILFNTIYWVVCYTNMNESLDMKDSNLFFKI